MHEEMKRNHAAVAARANAFHREKMAQPNDEMSELLARSLVDEQVPLAYISKKMREFPEQYMRLMGKSVELYVDGTGSFGRSSRYGRHGSRE